MLSDNIIDNNIPPTTLIIIYLFSSFISALKKLPVHDFGVIRIGILTFLIKILIAAIITKSFLSTNLIYWILVSVRMPPLNDIYEVGICYFKNKKRSPDSYLFVRKYFMDVLGFCLLRFIALGTILLNSTAFSLLQPYCVFILLDTCVDWVFLLGATLYIKSNNYNDSPMMLQQANSHVLFRINIILRNNFIYSFLYWFAIMTNAFLTCIILASQYGSMIEFPVLLPVTQFINQNCLSLCTFLMILASHIYSLSINRTALYFNTLNISTSIQTQFINTTPNKELINNLLDRESNERLTDEQQPKSLLCGKDTDKTVNSVVVDSAAVGTQISGKNIANTDELLNKLIAGTVKTYSIESLVGDFEEAVDIRRQFFMQKYKLNAVESLPYRDYAYGKVYNQCAENVIGFASLPIGIVGPLIVNNHPFFIPLATTEGCLIASINRGIAAIRTSRLIDGSLKSVILNDAMTRCPVIKTPNLATSFKIKNWILDSVTNYDNLKKAFESTSRFCRLQNITCHVAGNLIFIRFCAGTGEAMGMNMISKATQSATDLLMHHFDDCYLISLSGNMCSDKKAAAINWINGRGKSVSCETTIDKEIVKRVLKVHDIDILIEAHVSKNYIGSAMAGTFGGFNSHAANTVAAIFAATGQDLGQIVESSNCIIVMEKTADGDLYISCTMPSIEVGTIGGGTILPSQQSCLNIMNVFDNPISSSASQTLAMLVCSTTLAGELSLLSSLVEGTLVKSHLKYNRKN